MNSCIPPSHPARMLYVLQAYARGAVSGWQNELGAQQELVAAQRDTGTPGVVFAVAAGFIWGRPALLLPLAKYAADMRISGEIRDRRAARYVGDAAEGLSALHLLNLVHRGVKAGNILLYEAEDHASYIAQLTDMGLVWVGMPV